MTVLAMRVYVFTCNAERCEETTGEITPPNADDGARSAWRVAQAEGWTRRGVDRHYCPRHRGHHVLARAPWTAPGVAAEALQISLDELAGAEAQGIDFNRAQVNDGK